MKIISGREAVETSGSSFLPPGLNFDITYILLGIQAKVIGFGLYYYFNSILNFLHRS
jgi:hypothetical protein